MLRKLHRTLTMATMASLVPVVMMTTPVAAQTAPSGEQAEMAAAATTQPATSLEQAGGPLAGWVELGPQQGQWYKFKYDYDNGDDDNEPTPALVRLKMDAPESVRFEVWTRARLNAPLPSFDDEGDDEDVGTVREPVGRGTPVKNGEEKVKNGDGTKETRDLFDAMTLQWVGGQAATETFYVFVRNTTDQPVRYLLNISGPDVSY